MATWRTFWCALGLLVSGLPAICAHAQSVADAPRCQELRGHARANCMLQRAEASDAAGDVSHALADYRAYLRGAKRAPDVARVSARIDALAEQLARLGVQQLWVVSTPVGARAFVDNEPVGMTPLTVDITPGKHTLRVSSDGYQSMSGELDMPREQPLDVAFALHAHGDESTQLASTRSDAPLLATGSVAPAQRHSTLRTLGLVSLGASVAALGSALTFEILQAETEGNLRQERDRTKLAEQQNTLRSQQSLARMFAGTGGALAALGGILMIAATAGPERKPREGLALACQPTKCQATMSGTF